MRIFIKTVYLTVVSGLISMFFFYSCGDFGYSKDTDFGENASEIALPGGVIVMWSGALSNIPDGWALCDGTGGTPDLTNRFILSISSSADVTGETGGVSEHSHAFTEVPKHMHDFEGKHRHNYSYVAYSDTKSQIASGTGTFVVSNINQGNINGITFDPNTDSSYLMAVKETGKYPNNSGSALKDTAATNVSSSLPPYYKLAFIMKL